MDQTDNIINDGLDLDFLNTIDGDISKINHDLQDDEEELDEEDP